MPLKSGGSCSQVFVPPVLETNSSRPQRIIPCCCARLWFFKQHLVSALHGIRSRRTERDTCDCLEDRALLPTIVTSITNISFCVYVSHSRPVHSQTNPHTVMTDRRKHGRPKDHRSLFNQLNTAVLEPTDIITERPSSDYRDGHDTLALDPAGKMLTGFSSGQRELCRLLRHKPRNAAEVQNDLPLSRIPVTVIHPSVQSALFPLQTVR